MPLSVKEKVALRGDAMRLKPALKIGRGGFSEGVQAQLEQLLDRHGLLKLRLELSDRDARAALATEMAAATGAELVGSTGKTVVLYRTPRSGREAEED